MAYTTIAIRKELRDKILEYGMKGETYDQIIAKLLESARQRQLHDLLFSKESTTSIEEALEEAKKKWRK